jgi:hypothetical protein
MDEFQLRHELYEALANQSLPSGAASQLELVEAFRRLGMDEAMARAAAVGRKADYLPPGPAVDLTEAARRVNPTTPPVTAVTYLPRAAADERGDEMERELAERFRSLGLSEAAAQLAARGRD